MAKKRRVPGITVYQRGKKWSYIIYGEPNILTSKRERTYDGGFQSEDDAWDAALKKKAELDTGRLVKPSSRTVDQFFTEWLAAIRGSIKKSTYANYRTNFEAYVKPMIGHRRLQEISVPVLNAFYVHLLESGRVKANKNAVMYAYWNANRHMRNGIGPTPTLISATCEVSIHAAKAAVVRFRRGRIPREITPGLSVKSVKNVHRMMHVAFGEAVAWQYLSFNPAEHAKLPRERRSSDKKNRPTPWTVEELARWLIIALGDRFAGMWVLAGTSGTRRSELAGVGREQLTLLATCQSCGNEQLATSEGDVCAACSSEELAFRGSLAIEDTRVVVDGQVEDEDGKSDDSVREISLDHFTVVAVLRHLSMLDEERKEFGKQYVNSGKLMCWADGTAMHPDTITRRFNRLVDEAGVRRIRLHDVRHTYATVSLDSGIDPKVVSDRVGHANMNVTLQIYTHRSTGQDLPAAELVAKLIEAAIEAERSRGQQTSSGAIEGAERGGEDAA